MSDNILTTIKKIIPAGIFNFLQPIYHYKLALIGALLYGFPARKIKVIGVTGTKGKSSTTEIINAILEKAGYKTALSNTIRFKIAGESRENLYKMSMPGRFFVQKFVRGAVRASCDYVVLEMTSQGSMQYRHKFLSLNTLVVTNISPEHIESHGSYEKYVDAKLDIARELVKSKKPNRAIIVNGDDKECRYFLEKREGYNPDSLTKVTYSLRDLELYNMAQDGLNFTFGGKAIHSGLRGMINLYNILATVTVAKSENVPTDVIAKAIEDFSEIKGRLERISVGQKFEVVVDYAHTTDSLEKFYKVFNSTKNICVLGGTGGGRDRWKRKEMGKIADNYCQEVILTNEDPYDEDPMQIINDVKEGVTSKEAKIIFDRKDAITQAIKIAKKMSDSGEKVAVLITGKGTDPYIMGPNGTKIPWSDSKIAKSSLENISY